MGPCFQFFDFCVSYTNLCFYAQGVAMKKWFFHHFFCVINITNTMTNIEIRDFVSIFSGKGLISIPIMESCAEFTQLTLRFHLLSAAQIHDRRARCHIHPAACHQDCTSSFRNPSKTITRLLTMPIFSIIFITGKLFLFWR